MKRIKNLSTLLLLIVTFGFVSCDTEPVDPVFLDYEPEVEDPASFEVNIDGELFVAAASSAAIGDGLIAIQGIGSDGESVSIVLEGTTASNGTYAPEDVLMIYQPSENADDYGFINFNSEIVGGGEVPEDIYYGAFTITNIDTVNKTISGTFSFTGYWSNPEDEIEPVELTNGVFINVPYIDSDIDPDPEEEEDYIIADINGVETDFTIAVAASSGNFLTISGQNVAPPKQIQLLMDADIEEGTYDITEDGGFGNGVTGLYSEGLVLYVVTSGQLTIISNDGESIKGVFEFAAYNSDDESDIIEVTNGEFEMLLP
ncbi:hypothetical protein E0W68_11325 [Flavobacterium salilacus subsp. salilacus]|uniref:DUF6252 family protein n=1 Tax=Flavobacterium TaxID=237 RepID=UPI001074B1F6|nr:MULTISPECIES: DUF6252 family protein [Flavobacterium]KAF2517551.1 hypothetical protein E0W68_11325 [Flavobacterium salilacus subsp. salilacus]MBE1615700.1 hypothetical protein [Flavobacterium sp. SaA2.13]NDI99774.1 hypothetical protein [Flavobacterium salilacus subsp. altitudinum]